MKIQFKQGSQVASIVQKMFEKKELMHTKAIQIIEEETGCKIKAGSGLGFRYAFSFCYDYSFAHCYFEDVTKEVPGYKQEFDKDKNIGYRINRRTKAAKNIEARFKKEIFAISSRQLNDFGIKTETDGHWYGWRLTKEDNGEISMVIHPGIYDLIDFDKAKDITIIQ